MSELPARDMRHIDLDNVRLTLEYIYGDLKDVGSLGRVSGALRSAIEEIDAVRTGRRPSRLHRLLAPSPVRRGR